MRTVYIDFDDTLVGYKLLVPQPFLRCGTRYFLKELSYLTEINVLSFNDKTFIANALIEFDLIPYISEIYDYTYVASHRNARINPSAVLIDDYDISDPITREKMAFLGIGPKNLIVVESASTSKVCLDKYLPLVLERIHA